MKKGLLSILALAVTIVGCQNYDDQFDALNTQISALKSQVEGLAGVQTQITSLAGTLSALQSTVASLPSSSDVSSAIASELTDIISQVEALQAALDAVATADDLSDVSDAVTDAQNALNDLLDSSNVYADDLVVTNQGTLDFAVALGEKLAIVNGSVYINVSAQMNTTDVQTVLDNIGTVVEDFSYIAASTVSPVTFNNIMGVAGDLEASQAGPYAFEGLMSAGNIHLVTGTKMTAVHFDALTTVTSINVSTLTDHGSGSASAAARVASTITSANAISGTKLAAVRLGSLPYYTPGALSITTDGEESTVDISMLASVDADGDDAALNLLIDGAMSVDFSKITVGDITAHNVTNLTGGSEHDGDVTISEVANVVLPNLTGDFSYDADDSALLTFHAIGGKTTATGATYPALNLDGFNKLTSVIIEGTFGNVTLNDNSRLTDVTYTATADALAITANNDIEALAIGGKASSITISNNTNILTADIDTKLGSGNAATAPTAGSLTVHNNSDLEALHSAYDPVDTIQIHHNGSLAMVDFEGTASAGATTDAVDVNIGGDTMGNALTALSVVDSYDAAAATTDTGVMSDEAGLSSLSAWITAATENTAYDIQIYLDEIEEYTPAGATATATVDTIDNIDWDDATNNGQLLVVSLTPGTAATTTPGTAAVAGMYAWQFDVLGGNPSFELTHSNPVNSVQTELLMITASALNTNPTLAVDEILADADMLAASEVIDVTVNAIVGGQASIDVTFDNTQDSTTTEESVAAATSSSVVTAADDEIHITIGSTTITGTTTANTTGAGIAADVVSIWNAGDSMFTASAAGNVVTFEGDLAYGSLTNGKTVSIAYATGTSTATTPIVAYQIGFTTETDDNDTESTNVIVTVTSDDSGVDANVLQAGAVAMATAGTVNALTVSATANVATAADATADTTTAAVAGASVNRLTWISGS
jgi:prefoldin subunit 5